ncbi:hypothetical protein AMATHDRAFT_77004 [Amanita thiersii Skay4041]|uniref:Uncharacterized protein n=1 Tax=Amanita thiersii Skay4041 TaxID=703135 RepID=A0A2A9NJF6_9AGAR|nr:hypothetical protein AMATHDRAFT_77004 [Amanita thiersii Skay4041]
MLSLASFHLRNLYDTALDYLNSPRIPSADTTTRHESVPVTNNTPPTTTPLSILTPAHIHYAQLRERLDAARPSNPTHASGQTPTYMRRELDYTKTELARTKSDVAILEERCKVLEKTLKDTRDMLRTREVEVEKVKKERDRERALSQRRRSDSVPLYQSPQKPEAAQPIRSSFELRTNGSSNHLDGRPTTTKSLVGAGPLTPPSLPSAAPGATTTGPRSPTLPVSLSDEERARNRSHEAYMTRTDSWSGAQVLQTLHDINAEILQFAASATEVCSFDQSDSRMLSSSRSVQSMHDTSSRLGPNLARILSGRDHSQDPLLVQLALQGCVTMCIARSLSAFCLGFPAESDNILSQIYARMSLAEPQPTSSKWRALTHRNIHALYPTLDDYATHKLAESIIRWAADIFLISGCTSFLDMYSSSLSSSPPKLSSSPNSRSLASKPSYASFASSAASFSTTASTNTNSTNAVTYMRDTLRSHFGDQIRRLARSATRLAMTLREEILSTSFDVVAVDHTQPFDSTVMVDMFKEYTPIREEGSVANGQDTTSSVLATTELGVRCTTRMGTKERVGLDEDITIERRLLLKPKVVLGSILEVLDR